MSASSRAANRARIKPVALPAEHGGWGFLFEPIALGLLVAPSLAGLFLGIAFTGVFLARHPFKLVVADRRKGRRFSRTTLAERFILLYGSIALLSLTAAVLMAGWHILQPMMLVVPFFVLQLVFDMRNNSRHWLPELGGPVALASSAAAIAMARGWLPGPAITMASILIARSVPSVLYVRARLRLERGSQPAIYPAILAHAVAIGFAAVLAFQGLIPWLAVVPLIVLLARAAYGLSPYRRPIAAKTVGFQELGLGLFTVVMAAIGYMTGI